MMKTVLNWIIGEMPNHLTQQQKDWLRLKFKLKAYVVIAILTFGFNAAAHPSYHIPGTLERSTEPNTGLTIGNSMAAGIAWPLYWTWEGFTIFVEPDAPPADAIKLGDKK